MSVLIPEESPHLALLEALFVGSLRTTLAIVYSADPDLAAEYVHELRNAPPLQRTLALHDDPLEVASLLTGLSVTAERTALYDSVRHLFSDDHHIAAGEPVAESTPPPPTALREAASRVVLQRAREKHAPLVRLTTLNELMSKLGYMPLRIKAGVATFYSKKGVRSPLPVFFSMSNLPGRDADREDVYALDTIVLMLDGLQKYARVRKRSKKVVSLIAQLRAEVVKDHT